mmetsp:Transcript_13306/g.38658  ORF Transcript_13306/g.38658 Transcript_13306/m.38658 type:complete len:130 (-) Transcript_13306:58-447(-)|eukprot:366331-Chlamydomonas_euryale.AAC.37
MLATGFFRGWCAVPSDLQIGPSVIWVSALALSVARDPCSQACQQRSGNSGNSNRGGMHVACMRLRSSCRMQLVSSTHATAEFACAHGRCCRVQSPLLGPPSLRQDQKTVPVPLLSTRTHYHHHHAACDE